jgi:hypothetical protein
MFKSVSLQVLNFLKKPTVLLAMLATVALVFSLVLYLQNRSTQAQLKKLKDVAKTVTMEDTKKLLTELGKLMQLPDEEPTIATVTDKAKLKDQPFFNKAENNDTVFIFTQAKRAILYRSSVNKIIDVAPINVGDQVAGASTSTTPATTRRPSPTP